MPDAEVSANSFRVSLLAYERGLMLALEGELDLTGVAAFEAAIEAASCADAAELILDFGGLTFVDSTGVTAIVAAMTRAQQTGRPLYGSGVSGQVKRVLELTGVLPRLSLVERPGDDVVWPIDG